MLEDLLDYSTTQFMSLGIRSVSMDDIASGRGMSKKTLYQHVQNKSDLVTQAISRHLDLEVQAIDHIITHADDAIDEMVKIANHTLVTFRQIKPA